MKNYLFKVPDNPNPTFPPNELCEYGWHYDKDSEKCVYFTSDEKSWQAGQEFCRGKGGTLASINSPFEQDMFWNLGMLDPSAIGLFHLPTSGVKSYTND